MKKLIDKIRRKYWLTKLWFLERKIKNTVMVTDYYRFMIYKGFYHDDLTPKVCMNCGHNGKIQMLWYKQITKNSMEGWGVMEFEARCNHCDNVVGYWSYGHWEA